MAKYVVLDKCDKEMAMSLDADEAYFTEEAEAKNGKSGVVVIYHCFIDDLWHYSCDDIDIPFFTLKQIKLFAAEHGVLF